ncbi:LysR substrate-binding domain-containing protein [Acanthopleuribacter pedis]|uniref:LysR family transcriptional regulator n=1 Tax=Acanthopleuribacter pedis TaxID=442870 RepID=A0A8J7QE47_9BACT|nr:LysR substrate-binding domain-containing protein [Acanthopleuribacter pedis]MBO1321390.1 LysR family transcriptional regulator [Acanthopleuribacter pedis]
MYAQLPLNGLRVFEAAARHLSFQCAADELHVSPTAVSHQIRQLETHLGRALFTRRPLALTEAGAALYPQVHQALDLLADAHNRAQTTAQPAQLRVSMTHAFAGFWLLPRLTRFHARFPEITIKVDASERCADLARGEADCSIRYSHAVPEDWVGYPLFRDRFFPVCAPSRLPDFADGIGNQRLLHFSWKVPHPHNPDWARWFQRFPCRRRRVPAHNQQADLFLSEETHAIQAARDGHGLALCSSLMTASLIQENQLAVPFEGSLPGLHSTLIFLPNHPKKRLIHRFRDWLRAETQCFRTAYPADFFDDPE